MKLNKQQTNLYLKSELVADMREVGEAQERSLGWLVEAAWKIARAQIVKQKNPAASSHD